MTRLEIEYLKLWIILVLRFGILGINDVTKIQKKDWFGQFAEIGDKNWSSFQKLFLLYYFTLSASYTSLKIVFVKNNGWNGQNAPLFFVTGASL